MYLHMVYKFNAWHVAFCSFNGYSRSSQQLMDSIHTVKLLSFFLIITPIVQISLSTKKKKKITVINKFVHETVSMLSNIHTSEITVFSCFDRFKYFDVQHNIS
jgi:hypothetical protein